MKNRYIVSYSGSSGYETYEEAEKKLKQKALGNQEYDWYIYQAIAQAELPSNITVTKLQ